MSDSRRKFGRSKMYRAEWKDGPDVERWLDRMSVGRTLNFPCGRSPWGDVRADADPENKPDVLADLFHPPFDTREFGTVYVDPPYSLTAYDKILSWLPNVWEIVDDRLILNSPPICAWLQGAVYSHFVERRPGSPHLALYHVYDRPDGALTEFGRYPDA